VSQNQLCEPVLSTSQTLFPLYLRNVNSLFPGFAAGDFAVINGSSAVTSLASLLCVRAQLAHQLGGLNSNVVFIDGSNTFQLYQITRLAQLHKLNPKQVLDNIYIARAFTAYQLATLIMQKLQVTTQKSRAKLVIISDLSEFFLDNGLSDHEAQRVFSQVITYLSNFANENHLIIITTNSPHKNTKRNGCLQNLMHQKANVILTIGQTAHFRTIRLEKHLYFKLGSIELPSPTMTLMDYVGRNA
jgi:hypothetical protein